MVVENRDEISSGTISSGIVSDSSSIEEETLIKLLGDTECALAPKTRGKRKKPKGKPSSSPVQAGLDSKEPKKEKPVPLIGRTTNAFDRMDRKAKKPKRRTRKSKEPEKQQEDSLNESKRSLNNTEVEEEETQGEEDEIFLELEASEKATEPSLEPKPEKKEKMSIFGGRNHRRRKPLMEDSPEKNNEAQREKPTEPKPTEECPFSMEFFVCGDPKENEPEGNFENGQKEKEKAEMIKDTVNRKEQENRKNNNEETENSEGRRKTRSQSKNMSNKH